MAGDDGQHAEVLALAEQCASMRHAASIYSICLPRFAFLKAFLLNRDLDSIQVDAYYEECLELLGAWRMCAPDGF